MNCTAEDPPEWQDRAVPGKDYSASSGRSPVSPEEGADLIRAFLYIEQKGVRAAIIELVKRLSQELAKTNKI